MFKRFMVGLLSESVVGFSLLTARLRGLTVSIRPAMAFARQPRNGWQSLGASQRRAGRVCVVADDIQ